MLRRAAALLAFLLLLALVQPAASSTAAQPVQGYVDTHNHLMSHEAFGGKLICGQPFHPDGPARALVDCLDHYPNGELAWFENFTRTGQPTGTHDPGGWPTFRDWPANDSMTHQQNYYEWIERAWRGGLRVMVNDLVANRQLCEVYPLKGNSCDEMTTIRLEAKRTFELQDLVDAEAGGPGRGWFRVVRTPAEAREVITSGKLAVVLGIETSEPFGCRTTLGVPHCTKAQIDRGLDEVRALGVSSMFVCHKYDNALCGVRFDSGAQGVIVNAGNFLSSGSFWRVQPCAGTARDNTIEPGVLPKELSFGIPPLPVYPPGPHCNVKGLTSLGRYMIEGMIARGMLVELDHMSVKAAGQTLDLLESRGYPGVISSHSWTDSSYFRRIYQLGGMITSISAEADGFTRTWRETKALRDELGKTGFGYGMDANGMHALPGPRANSAVTYPLPSGLDRLTTGRRVWDYNVDGVANYGLVPDWFEDMRAVAGDEFTSDMAAGAESYLRTWEAARARVTG